MAKRKAKRRKNGALDWKPWMTVATIFSGFVAVAAFSARNRSMLSHYDSGGG